MYSITAMRYVVPPLYSQRQVYTQMSQFCEFLQMFDIKLRTEVLYEDHRDADIFHAQAYGVVSTQVILGTGPDMYILLIGPFNDGRRCRANESAAGPIERFDMDGTTFPWFLPQPPFYIF